MKKYDVGIIGAGPAGLAAAFALQAQGKQVVMIESYLWGGTCPNYGCDPKKVLLAAVEAKEYAQLLQGKGVQGVPTINWPELMTSKKTFTDPVSRGTFGSVTAAGITTYQGKARFQSATEVLVANERITADNWIIATGARPATLTVPGGELAKTSEDFLGMEKLPASITFVGAGYVALELAVIANAAGSNVQILTHGETILPAFDQELVADFVEQLTQRGIKIVKNVAVTALAQQENTIEITTATENYRSEMVIAATGRPANIDDLNLDALDVEWSRHGIKVDQQLRTGAQNIFAIGDVADTAVPKLTPVGSFEGRYVAAVLAGNQEPIQYTAIPTVVYGAPKLAQAGAVATATTFDVTGWFTYRRIGENVAKVKIATNEVGQLIGASVLATEADQLINYLTNAINQKWTLADAQANIMAYPTMASDLQYFF
ncbi:dihydrolipoyl dehydrogenase family protein [Periweissella cryptocerci]|nr:NAD(P)/FAD-dependent oxidoreductase [Periweissella cryptocerci]